MGHKNPESLGAWHNVVQPTIGKRLQKTYAQLQLLDGATARELATANGDQRDNYANRLNELRRMGVVHNGESRKDNHTGVGAQTWFIGSPPPETILGKRISPMQRVKALVTAKPEMVNDIAMLCTVPGANSVKVVTTLRKMGLIPDGNGAQQQNLLLGGKS